MKTNARTCHCSQAAPRPLHTPIAPSKSKLFPVTSTEPLHGLNPQPKLSRKRSSASLRGLGIVPVAANARLPELTKGTEVQELRHRLPDGQELEVLFLGGAKLEDGHSTAASVPPLLFVHGSGHAAWCWQEHFMPYFAARGYDCYAVSLRSQGNSSRAVDAVAGTLQSNAEDLSDFVASLPSPPVAVGHSFGGLLLHKYINDISDSQQSQGFACLRGAAFLGAAPPSGNRALVRRIAAAFPWLTVKLTWGFITKSYTRSPAAARELFFSRDIPGDALERYTQLFAKYSSPVRVLDTSSLNEEVPLPPPPEHAPPTFVMGADKDIIVDVPAVEETAQHYGVKPFILKDTAHDIMLDTRWEAAAAALHIWLKDL